MTDLSLREIHMVYELFSVLSGSSYLSSLWWGDSYALQLIHLLNIDDKISILLHSLCSWILGIINWKHRCINNVSRRAFPVHIWIITINTSIKYESCGPIQLVTRILKALMEARAANVDSRISEPLSPQLFSGVQYAFCTIATHLVFSGIDHPRTVRWTNKYVKNWKGLAGNVWFYKWCLGYWVTRYCRHFGLQSPLEAEKGGEGL